MTTPPTKPKAHRGFAAMDPAKQRELARRGGQAAHERGTAHQFDSEEAAAAGRKGGAKVSKDRKHMAEIGSRGGRNRGKGSGGSGTGTDQIIPRLIDTETMHTDPPADPPMIEGA